MRPAVALPAGSLARLATLPIARQCGSHDIRLTLRDRPGVIAVRNAQWLQDRGHSRIFVNMGIVIATLIVLTVIASVLAQDYSIFSWGYWQEGDTSTSRSEVVRNLGLLAAGVIGLGFGIWRAYTAYRQTQASQWQAEAANEQARAANEQARAAIGQARVAEQGHFTERFSTAVEHLGKWELSVRLGGVYALWRLAQDSPERDVVPVIDILCAFIRHPPPVGPPQSGPSAGMADATQPGQEPSDITVTRLRPDVQTVMKLLGDKTASYRRHLPKSYRLHLSGADLKVADLRGADFTDAVLTDAKFTIADFRNADLTSADLRDADFTVAILADACLMVANLSGASLSGADLTNADFTGADLTDANLADADLEGSNISDADFSGANLKDASFKGANLTGANLVVAEYLTQKQLDEIHYHPDYHPELPPGLVLPEPLPE